MEKSVGIVIRLTKLTETSWIVHWLTQDRGMIKTVAKGGRRPKSTFAGKLDLFFESEFVWVQSRKSELHQLKEVSVLDFRESLRKRYIDTATASYFVTLLDRVVEVGLPVPELYDLLQRGLNYLGSKGADRRGLLHFEKELARLLGVKHERISAALSLEHAFGKLPRGRTSCLEMLD